MRERQLIVGAWLVAGCLFVGACLAGQQSIEQHVRPPTVAATIDRLAMALGGPTGADPRDDLTLRRHYEKLAKETPSP